jgi:hypothetical protein
MDTASFFFSFESDLLETAQKLASGGLPKKCPRPSVTKTLAVPVFIVQNESCLFSNDSPCHHTRSGRDWPASAVKLFDVLAGESPASANCPVGTVVISGDGAGDQTVGSLEVKVLVGWMRIWSAPTRRASEAAGRSASEP